MNKVWFELLCLNLYFRIAILNCPNHARGDCFRPYSALCSLHTTLVSVDAVYPGGGPCIPLLQVRHGEKHFLHQIDVVASQGWLQEITGSIQCSVLQLVRTFLDSQPHRFVCSLLPPVLLCTFLQIRLPCV
jgi:hypothetical protein